MVNVPLIDIYEFNTAEISSPIGNRHIEGGSFAFKQKVALGYNQYSGPGTSGTLVFENLKFNVSIPTSDVSSKVTAIIVRMANASAGGAIYNMRLYLAQASALSGSLSYGLDPAIVQYAVSGVWQPNPIWPSGITTRLPQLVPTTPNLFRQDGAPFINANQDADVSQFVYLNVVIPNGFPPGRYGIIGSGLLRPALIFDYS